MREIKFRGYNGEKWLFGNLDIDYKAKHACISDNRFWRHPVRFDTVGQFTGLCDCKGQNIYEGDVVAFGDFFREHDVENEYWHGVVKWDPERARFVLDELDFDEDVCNDELLVIGNVHDNPQLLENSR